MDLVEKLVQRMLVQARRRNAAQAQASAAYDSAVLRIE
jgi:hypothetical protein